MDKKIRLSNSEYEVATRGLEAGEVYPIMLIKTPLTKPMLLMYTDLCSFGSICLSEEKHSRLKLPINSLPHIHVISSPTTLIELS